MGTIFKMELKKDLTVGELVKELCEVIRHLKEIENSREGSSLSGTGYMNNEKTLSISNLKITK